MVTNPDELPEPESFREAFPGFFREAVTGSERGEARTALLLIVAAACLVWAPLPFSAIGIIALIMLNIVRK